MSVSVRENAHLVPPSQKSSESFFRAAKHNGYELRPSINKEKDHDIDYVVWDPDDKDKAFAVSLKNTLLKKSKKRKHLWGWVELRNRYGDSGWISSKSTFIVYERKNDFVLIFKNDLRKWIEVENIGRWDLPFVESGWKAAYRLYRRPNTKEAIFHLKISDALKKCRHHIWLKNERDS